MVHYGYWATHCGGLRWGRFTLEYKAPASPPLFSERYGYVKTLLSFKGYRLLYHWDEKPEPAIHVELEARCMLYLGLALTGLIFLRALFV